MEMWKPQVEALSGQFRLLRYDARGHGRSDVPAGAYGLDRLGRDVVELLDALGIAKAHFCGLSMGGMVGQWLGVRAPERLDKLVLANTSAYMGPPSGWDDRIAAVRAGGLVALAEGTMGRWFTPGFIAREPGTLAAVCAMLLACPPDGYAGCCAAIRDMDLRPTAPLVRAETLVIAGAHDPPPRPRPAAGSPRPFPAHASCCWTRRTCPTWRPAPPSPTRWSISSDDAAAAMSAARQGAGDVGLELRHQVGLEIGFFFSQPVLRHEGWGRV